MSAAVNAIVAVVLVSLISFVGALALSMRHFFDRYLHMLVAFAAGTMVAAALTDFIPESVAHAGEDMFFVVIMGIIVFMVVEKLLYWYHCHFGTPGHEHGHGHGPKTYTYLNLIGDAIHNFLDGAIIAAAFSSSTALGVTAMIAVILHEIPQELGDFAVLIHGGFTKSRALLLNFLSAIAAVVGAVVALYFIGTFEALEAFALAFSGGAFLYIALVDLLPELHHKPQMLKSIAQVTFFLLGIGVIMILNYVLPHAI